MRIIISNALTTTATGTFEVISYTVPSGYKLKLKNITIGGEPTTWSTTEANLGYCYLQINGVDYRGLEDRAMQGDAVGIYGSVGSGKDGLTGTFGAGFVLSSSLYDIELNEGDVIKVIASPASTTSTRWRATIIADLIAKPIIETTIAISFPMLYLPKPIRAQELKSKVEGATITKTTQDYPQELIKKGKAQELRSKFS